MVNNKGDLYKISNLNSSPMDIKKIATSKELTAKSESFAMTFMTLADEEAIVLAWVDSSKGVGYVKKIPTSSGVSLLSFPPLCNRMPNNIKLDWVLYAINSKCRPGI